MLNKIAQHIISPLSTDHSKLEVDHLKNRNFTASIMLSKHYLISLTNMLQEQKNLLKIRLADF